MGLKETKEDRERNRAIAEGFSRVAEAILDAADHLEDAIREAGREIAEAIRERRGEEDGK